jgi:hypothetical protein
MSRAHSAKRPEDCVRCCEVHQVLAGEHARRAEQTDVRARAAAPLTVAEIGGHVGIRDESVVRTHLAHLAAHGHLLADRRTPTGVPVGRGTEQPEESWGPDQWAANQQAPHPACGDLLVLLGGIGWSGAVPAPEAMAAMLADRARGRAWSVRTIKEHRPHLGPRREQDKPDAVRAGLVLFTPRVLTLDDGRRVRHTDGFVLLTGQVTAPLREDPSVVAALAVQVFDRLAWWPGHAPVREGERARKAIASRLLAGWPADVLIHRLSPIPQDYVVNGYGLLSARLPAPGEPYRETARAAVQGRTEPLVCPACRNPRPARARYCGGDVCRDRYFGTSVDDLVAAAGADVAADVWVPGGRRPVLAPAF